MEWAMAAYINEVDLSMWFRGKKASKQPLEWTDLQPFVLCEQVPAGRQEWGAFSVPPPSTDSPPWLSKELAELPHPSATPLQIRLSPHPPGSGTPAVPHNTPLPLVSLQLTEIKGSTLRKVACIEKWKWGELCQCAMTRHDLSQNLDWVKGRWTVS